MRAPFCVVITIFLCVQPLAWTGIGNQLLYLSFGTWPWKLVTKSQTPSCLFVRLTKTKTFQELETSVYRRVMDLFSTFPAVSKNPFSRSSTVCISISNLWKGRNLRENIESTSPHRLVGNQFSVTLRTREVILVPSHRPSKKENPVIKSSTDGGLRLFLFSQPLCVSYKNILLALSRSSTTHSGCYKKLS